jgi:hypothetical protein
MGILKIKELQSSNGDTVLGINDDGTINITSQYNPGNVILTTWDQTTRPTTGLFPGYVGYNTEKRRFELFTGFDDRGDPTWYGVQTRVRFSAYDYTDTSLWDSNEGTMFDKAYLPMPGGPRTMLSYVTSFGLNQSSSNNNNSSWSNGHDVRSFEYRKNGNYFNSGNLVMFNGDGSSDGGDWVLFNFGNLRGGDFNPKWAGNQSGWAFFGGEFNQQSVSTSGQSISRGYIWGFSDAAGWIKLWQDDRSGSWGKNNSSWYSSGGTTSSGNGKRSEYDNEPITYIGFSVR